MGKKEDASKDYSASSSPRLAVAMNFLHTLSIIGRDRRFAHDPSMVSPLEGVRINTTGAMLGMMDVLVLPFTLTIAVWAWDGYLSVAGHNPAPTLWRTYLFALAIYPMLLNTFVLTREAVSGIGVLWKPCFVRFLAWRSVVAIVLGGALAFFVYAISSMDFSAWLSWTDVFLSWRQRVELQRFLSASVPLLRKVAYLLVIVIVTSVAIPWVAHCARQAYLEYRLKRVVLIRD